LLKEFSKLQHSAISAFLEPEPNGRGGQVYAKPTFRLDFVLVEPYR